MSNPDERKNMIQPIMDLVENRDCPQERKLVEHSKNPLISLFSL